MIHRAARCALLIFLKREQPRIPVRDLLAPVVDHVREGRAGSVRACGPPHLLPAVQVLRATQPEDRRPVAGTRKSACHWQIAGPRFHFSCSSSAPSALAPRLGAVLLDLRACVHLQASLCHNCCASLASRSDARSSRCSRRFECSRVVLGQSIVSSYCQLVYCSVGGQVCTPRPGLRPVYGGPPARPKSAAEKRAPTRQANRRQRRRLHLAGRANTAGCGGAGARDRLTNEQWRQSTYQFCPLKTPKRQRPEKVGWLVANALWGAC